MTHRIIRYLKVTIVLVAASIVGCAAAPQKVLVGEWAEIGGTEQLEFFADGTLSVVNNGVALTGKYSFPADDRITVELGGLAALAGPQLFTTMIADDELILTDAKGEVTRYSRVHSE